MGFLLGLAIGIILMSVVIFIAIGVRTVGNLRIDRSDPTEPPLCFMELYQSPDKLKQGRLVVLRVLHKNFISQK